MPSWAPGAISATIGIFCYIGAWVFYRVLKKWEVVAPCFMLVGTMGIGGSQLGQLAHFSVDWLQTMLVAQIGKYTGATLTGVVGLVSALYFLIHVLKDRKVKKVTLVSAVIAPLTVASIPGPAGAIIGGAFGLLGALVSAIIGGILGIH